ESEQHGTPGPSILPHRADERLRLPTGTSASSSSRPDARGPLSQPHPPTSGLPACGCSQPSSIWPSQLLSTSSQTSTAPGFAQPFRSSQSSGTEYPSPSRSSSPSSTAPLQSSSTPFADSVWPGWTVGSESS